MTDKKHPPAHSDEARQLLPRDLTQEQMIADSVVVPSLNAALTLNAYQGNISGLDVHLGSLMNSLEASMDHTKRGDLSKLEEMLVGQATALETIFASLAQRAAGSEDLTKHERYLNLALRAQAQSRSTIQALIELKFPRQPTFVKQANIAHGPQQVNNLGDGHPASFPSASHAAAQANPIEQNELLVEGTNGSTALDFRAKAGAARRDPAMVAVGTGSRPSKPRRQGRVIA